MKQKFISLPITDSIDELLADPRPVVALNLMGLYLFASDIIRPGRVVFWVDGIFGSLACWLNHIHLDRIPGRDLVEQIIVHLANHKASECIKILGGPRHIENINILAGHTVRQIDFPYLSETELMSFDYSQFSADDVVIIAVASPKQELIAEIVFSKTKAKCICAGGAINMLAGQERSAPKFIVKMGLESIFRLQHEPFRRIQRVVRTLPKGGLGVFRIKLHDRR